MALMRLARQSQHRHQVFVLTPSITHVDTGATMGRSTWGMRGAVPEQMQMSPCHLQSQFSQNWIE